MNPHKFQDWMKQETTLKIFRVAILAVGYFLLGHASFKCSVSHEIVTLVVFAPEGIALGMGLYFGYSVFPGVFIGQLLLALTSGLGINAAIGISTINSAELILAIYVFRAFKLHSQLDRLKDLIAFFALVFLCNQVLSASLGVGWLFLLGIVPASDFGGALFSWWFGNGLGQLLVAPLVLTLLHWKVGAKETIKILGFSGFTSILAMAIIYPSYPSHGLILAFTVLIPLMVLSSVWGGLLMASLSTTLVAVFVLEATISHIGPFYDKQVQILNLNLFLLGLAVTSQLMAVLFSERKRANDALQRYVDIIDKYVIISSTDLKGIIVSCSTAFSKISGYSKEELIGRNHNIVRDPDTSPETYREMWGEITKGNTWRGTIKNRNKNGESYWVEALIEPLFDAFGNRSGYTSIRTDITDKMKIEKLSVTDHLTGLFNRLKLDEVLQKEFQRSERYQRELSLIIFDLDHFKKVNDTFGHQMGDEVLVFCSKLINKKKRKTDTVGRWGGEEFLVICPETDMTGIMTVAENLRIAFESASFPHGEAQTISVGVATLQKGETLSDIIRRADNALYTAKRSGRNQVCG